MADPGFPVGGGADPLGGANLRRIHFLVKTYVKIKEIDPVGGGGARAAAPPLDPPMLMDNIFRSMQQKFYIKELHAVS